MPRRYSYIHLCYVYVSIVFLTSRCMSDAVCAAVCVWVYFAWKVGVCFVLRCLHEPFLLYLAHSLPGQYWFTSHIICYPESVISYFISKTWKWMFACSGLFVSCCMLQCSLHVHFTSWHMFMTHKLSETNHRISRQLLLWIKDLWKINITQEC